MNVDNVISGDAASNLTGKEYRVVKITSTGIDLAVSGDTKILGTLIRAQPVQENAVYPGHAVAVQRRYAGLHYGTIGNSSAAVLIGAGLILDPANPGMLIPSETNPIAASWENFTAQTGAIVRIVYI